MKIKLFRSAALCGLTLANVAHGFDLGAHARMSYQALQQSSIYKDPLGVFNLGLSSGWRTDLLTFYVDTDLLSSEIRTTWAFDSSKDKMPKADAFSLDVDDYRTLPHGWLMSGAIREDDGSFSTQSLATKVIRAEPEPHDDPWGNIDRFCNHFFDPFNNRPLTQYCPSEVYGSAPVWAIGVQGPFAVPLTTYANPVRRNHFSVIDARESMWQALTGMDRQGEVVAPEEYARRARWATMFRALGDVLHLNQDMAQPQHTRNEGHGIRDIAWYEKYIDGRARGLRSVTFSWRTGKLTADNLQPLSYLGYPAPAFNWFSDYWSTGLGTASYAGKGLADYTSRGFFTFAKNIGNREFARPNPARSAYTEVVISSQPLMRDVYLDGTVYDAFLGESSRPIHMVRAGLLYDAVSKSAPQSVPGQPFFASYTLDRAVHDDHAELQIPRAVGYSTGLLNYYFRGQMAISPPDDGVYAVVDHSVEKKPDTDGFPTISLKVANVTQGDSMSRGKVIAAVRYHKDGCYVDDLSGAPNSGPAALACRRDDEQLVVSDPIDLPTGLGNQPTAFTFNFRNKIPINATDIVLQVVYRGVLGNEADAVAVVAKDLSEPTFFAYHNATDYIRIGNLVYTRNELDASPALLAQVRPASCVNNAVSPPHLVASCFQSNPVNMVLASGTKPRVINVSGLPVQRFFRLAFLAEGATTTFNQIVFTCLPSDPFVMNNLRWQMETDPYTGSQAFRYVSYSALRGIKGYAQGSCILSGDAGATSGADNRDVAMSNVAQKYPFAVQISD